MTEIETTYDEPVDGAIELNVRCRNCDSLDSLAEMSWVPRSMCASLYRTPEGTLIADLHTWDDEIFLEAEKDVKWGCTSCATEDEDFDKVFEILGPTDG